MFTLWQQQQPGICWTAAPHEVLMIKSELSLSSDPALGSSPKFVVATRTLRKVFRSACVRVFSHTVSTRSVRKFRR